jgi:hypothetical protein
MPKSLQQRLRCEGIIIDRDSLRVDYCDFHLGEEFQDLDDGVLISDVDTIRTGHSLK